jgi:tetratricopeptide (TPR) repeat protein
VTKRLRDALSLEQLDEIRKRAIEHAEAGRDDALEQELKPLLRAQRHQEEAALCLVSIVEGGHLPIQRALEVLRQIYDAHPRSESVLGLLGEALEQARDIDMLNDPSPERPLFADVANTLAELAAKAADTKAEMQLVRGLMAAARMMARQRDAVVESACRRLIEIDPNNSNHHYNFGLFLKTRGRFRDGVLANRTAIDLAGERIDSHEWNLGICATGAGQGELALEVWKRMDQKIAMGRFGLPDGRYAQVKVRLAERPLAERTSDRDHPGVEETIWIERLSPCHGIVRSVLYQGLGVDYGDVVLFDGAPITYHSYDGERVPVFPHLATLVRNGYRFFDFAGTQDQAGQLGDASVDLERDAIVYAHSEKFHFLCAACWRDPDVEHSHEQQERKHVVTGRIAAPPDLEPRELLRQLDAAIAKRKPCRIYVPELCEAAGLADRSAFERRRLEMIKARP